MTAPGDRPERERFLDRPENVRKVLAVLYAICGVLLALDLVNFVLQQLEIADLRHGLRWWEGLPSYYSVYGFVACVALVLIAKQMRRVLRRDEDFYDR